MGKGMNYIFRVRTNDGRQLLRPHIKRRENECVFSKPPRVEDDLNSHITIQRPSFTSLESAALKYLDNREEKQGEKVKIKSLFSKYKRNRNK